MQQRIYRRQLIGVQLLLPVRLPGEGKQFLILGGLCLDARRVLFQLLRQIRQALYVGVHLAPIHLLEKRLHLDRMGRLVPGTPGLHLLYQRFIFEEVAALDGLMGQILIQIRADAALGRVDLQPGENGQCLRLLPAALPLLGVGVFIVGNDAAVQRGVADLADAGGKGTADGFKAGLPVIGAADLRLGCGDHQQRQVVRPGKYAPRPWRIVMDISFHAFVQNGIADRLDHVAVVVGTAQTLRGE